MLGKGERMTIIASNIRDKQYCSYLSSYFIIVIVTKKYQYPLKKEKKSAYRIGDASGI